MLNLRLLIAIAIVTGLAISHFVAYSAGKDVGLEKYRDYKLSVELAQKQAAAEAEYRRAEQERTTREVVEGWAAAVDWLRRHPRVVRVREPADCGSGQVSAVSNAAGQSDAATTELRPGAEIGETYYFEVAECEMIVNRAVYDAAQLLWLQHWIKEQQRNGVEWGRTTGEQ